MKSLYISILLIVSFGARAEGLFDFLDPCIAAKDDYWEVRKDIVASIDEKEKAIPTAKATKEFHEFWWKEKRKLLRDYYDQQIAPVIAESGGDVEKGFEVWLVKQIAKQGGLDSVENIIDEEYRRVAKLGIDHKRKLTIAKLDESKKKLYDSCPSDVANQVFRGTVTVVSAPVNIVISNFEGAKRESGEIDKAIRATTGISVKDIKEHGVLGGKNSETRKACNTVAGLFGGKC